MSKRMQHAVGVFAVLSALVWIPSGCTDDTQSDPVDQSDPSDPSGTTDPTDPTDPSDVTDCNGMRVVLS